MRKFLSLSAVISIISSFGLVIWVIWNSMFPNLSNLIPIEQIEGGGVCKSELLVKNIGTEDQVVLKNVIYEKAKYLGTSVSQNTECAKIFYSNALGGYESPTMTPTRVADEGNSK